eukprot:1161388-Pelagomonas_calceolata.AAC.4
MGAAYPHPPLLVSFVVPSPFSPTPAAGAHEAVRHFVAPQLHDGRNGAPASAPLAAAAAAAAVARACVHDYGGLDLVPFWKQAWADHAHPIPCAYPAPPLHASARQSPSRSTPRCTPPPHTPRYSHRCCCHHHHMSGAPRTQQTPPHNHNHSLPQTFRVYAAPPLSFVHFALSLEPLAPLCQRAPHAPQRLPSSQQRPHALLVRVAGEQGSAHAPPTPPACATA